MRRWGFSVFSVFVFLCLICLILPPTSRAKSPNIVISEFRTFGPRGSTDEFIELYNLSQFGVDISGWEVWSSNPSGGSSRMFFIQYFGQNQAAIAP